MKEGEHIGREHGQRYGFTAEPAFRREENGVRLQLAVHTPQSIEVVLRYEEESYSATALSHGG